MTQKTSYNVRKLAMVAMLSAVASVLMILEFSVPLVPSFIKLDFSELPALIASFALGPLSGAAVCLVKNLIHLPFSQTAMIGELSNFILGVAFVVPSGIIYKYRKTRGGALAASLIGAAFMAVLCAFTNYFFVYPLFAKFVMPEEAILGMYKIVYPGVRDLWQALWIFNVPFTFVKGLIVTAITFLVYKHIAPFLKGKTKSM